MDSVTNMEWTREMFTAQQESPENGIIDKGLLRIANVGSRDTVYDRTRKNFDWLAIDENESSRRYFWD